METFFSIIIPLFNSAATLPDALESILPQTFTNYEIVLVDGGSTDGTLKFIERMRRQHGQLKIKLHSAPDKGIYDAMNTGTSLASGNWLYFMGGDDRLASPAVLAEVYRVITETGCDLIYGNVYGAFSGTRYVYDSLDKVLSTGIHHQSIFYKSGLFKQFGKYDLRYKIAADYDFTLRIFLGNRHRICYRDMDIAIFGEGGYSSANFDYSFFSGHYRILARNGGLNKISDPGQCLQKSIYCCLYLAQHKKNVRMAWSNLLFYVTRANEPDPSMRLKTLLRMLRWSLKPLNHEEPA